MIVQVERSEIDGAMAELARRYERASPIERGWMMALIDRAHTPSGGDCGFTAGWCEVRDGRAIAHVVPGPDLLDMLLPAAIVEDLLLQVRP